MSDLFPLFPEEKSIRELGRKILDEVHEEVNRRLKCTPGFEDHPVDYSEMERPYVLPFKIGQLVARIASLEHERDEARKEIDRVRLKYSSSTAWQKIARLEEALNRIKEIEGVWTPKGLRPLNMDDVKQIARTALEIPSHAPAPAKGEVKPNDKENRETFGVGLEQEPGE